MINLEKEEKFNKAANFAEEDLHSIKRQDIKENKRIFIPCDELPNENDERSEFLEGLVSFMEQETGKRYSYISADETELYEMKGFYIQAEPELADDYEEYEDATYSDDSFEEAISEDDDDKDKTAFIAIFVTILIMGLIILLFLALKQNAAIENTVQESAAVVTSTVTSDEISSQTQKQTSELAHILETMIRCLLLSTISMFFISTAVKLIKRINRN